jgi:antitoxin component of RelBE/YafQ-DinJ toxin-antitoxin module
MDVRSGDMRRWIGWTHAGPDQALTMRVDDVMAARVQAETGATVKDPTRLTLAKAALAKAVKPIPVEPTVEEPVKPAVERKP